MAGLIQSDALASLPMTVGEVAASIIGRPQKRSAGTINRKDFEHRSMDQIDGTGVLNSFQSVRPT